MQDLSKAKVVLFAEQGRDECDAGTSCHMANDMFKPPWGMAVPSTPTDAAQSRDAGGVTAGRTKALHGGIAQHDAVDDAAAVGLAESCFH